MRPRRLLAVLLLALLLLPGLIGSERSAWAQEASVLWTDATEAMGDGDDKLAVTLLNRLVDEHPEHALADDALFLAGNLLEDKLANPTEARSAYRKLLERFPDSRSALAAGRRLGRLDEGLGRDGQGAAVLIEFQDILQGFPNRDEEESIRLAKALATNNPQWSQLHQIYLWLAATTRRRGDLAAAQEYYETIGTSEAPATAKVRALLGITEVSILRGQHKRAEEALDLLGDRQGLSRSDMHAVDELRELLSQSRRRSVLLTASYAAFAAMQLLFLLLLRRECGAWKLVFAALRRPTTEFFYMLPVAALLIIMALTGHEEIGPAVAIICAGGLITTWLASAVLQHSKPLTTARAGLCATAGLLATVSVCYLALQRSQLIDLVVTTVRFGPE